MCARPDVIDAARPQGRGRDAEMAAKSGGAIEPCRLFRLQSFISARRSAAVLTDKLRSMTIS
jgi:hypothetical protein